MAVFGASNEAAGPVAIEAATVSSQALSINATLNKITTTIAGVWDLNETKNEAPKTANTVFVSHQNLSGESVIEGDDRKLVDSAHFSSGGKYRSIVKLFIKYENLGDNKFAHGTGWLIRPDLLVTAGHNVYSWKQSAGRAREIKVYAGYNGAASINTPGVQFRKAKRVVTTSHWLSNRGSMAHDFALVQLDEAFSDITPIQYIETPPKDKIQLGVVGYPADKYDEATGEKGGRMYELFEETEYNIMEQKDTMLQHYIDSNGGNSGGPVLRGSDLVAIATHVYGGDFNTASILGRYGNPVQDYLAALDLPLANPGQINLVPVGLQSISQKDAATGPQTAEIGGLGANVPASLGDGSAGAADPESWAFDNPNQILALARNYRQTLGAGIAVPIGAIITPMIAQAIDATQNGNYGASNGLVVKRAILADAALTAMEEQHAAEENTWDVLKDLINPPRKEFPRWKFLGSGIGIQFQSKPWYIADISAEVTRGLVLRSHLPVAFAATAESAMDVDAPAPTQQELQFLQALKHSSGFQEEGLFDDVGDFFKGAASTVVNTVADVSNEANKAVRNVGNAWDNAVNDAAAKVKEVPVVGDVFGTAVKVVAGKPDVIFNLADQVTGILAKGKSESAFDGEASFDGLRANIVRISQALILRSIIAEQYLAAQMNRPVDELKEEGFFDVLATVASKAAKAAVETLRQV